MYIKADEARSITEASLNRDFAAHMRENEQRKDVTVATW